MKKVLIILGAIFFVVIIFGVIVFMKIKSSPVPVIEVGNIELNAIEDGTYSGAYVEGPVKVKVTVQVADHKISDIVINQHENGLGTKAERITKDIIDQQSLDVDVISGATLSSNVIRKAIEVALTN